jgi:nitrite reductase (NADH) large subunit
MTRRTQLLVIGNGMVGQHLLEMLPAAAPFAVTVLGEEPRAAYDRVHLSSFLAGRSAADLALAPAGFFERAGMRLHLNERVTAIDNRR